MLEMSMLTANYGDEVKKVCIPLPDGHGAAARTVPAIGDAHVTAPPYTNVYGGAVAFSETGTEVSSVKCFAKLPILAVAKESEFTRREKAGWNKRGFGAVRVDTMQDAFELVGKEKYLFILIDADNVNYMPLMGYMSDITDSPIFVGTYHFSVAEEVKALQNGADVYAPFQHQPEDNILLALTLLQNHNGKRKRLARDGAAPSFILYDRLLAIPECLLVFCNDEEISVTKTEFNILHYLMINRGYILSYEQIYLTLWNERYDGADNHALWNHAQRLRKKLARATGTNGYIENVKGVGYRLPRNVG